MMQINNTIPRRNAGPNHEGKFSRLFRKFSPVIAEMRQFSAKSKSTRVLRGSDLSSDMAFAIWRVSVYLLSIWFPHHVKLTGAAYGCTNAAGGSGNQVSYLALRIA
jgi:hypothetical protein